MSEFLRNYSRYFDEMTRRILDENRRDKNRGGDKGGLLRGEVPGEGGSNTNGEGGGKDDSGRGMPHEQDGRRNLPGTTRAAEPSERNDKAEEGSDKDEATI